MAQTRERPTAAVTAVVTRCAGCELPAGRGYPGCEGCAERVERLLFGDWRALMETENVTEGTDAELELAEKVISERPGKRPWTCVDAALSVLRCPDCRKELGAGKDGCPRCAAANAHRWRWTAPTDQYPLRVAITVLRATHRHRASAVELWQLCLPFLLLGERLTPAGRQRITTSVLAGRGEELTKCTSIAELAGLPDLPWRASDRNPAPVASPAR